MSFLSLCRPSHQRQIVFALPVVTTSPASPRAADSPQPTSAVGTSPVSIHHRESVPASIPPLTESHPGLSPFPGTAASAVNLVKP
ncbi:hypothetical protein JOB18_042732 [Solea senegalensis]|uniref:Uncharacterized protein n=1 Tax=Solea senegalensis TaxID=28829 RepID=A0AAV6QEY4_SOLSE|nr:hypothetical protein JOB18_042732 [Solea senegalensis]KAG7486948.1 hypothetical protein JOB18_042732 [Solea senegalensis]KAG7486949.1 hypothetical protein JOB18_042732 [Solea senegalensis]